MMELPLKEIHLPHSASFWPPMSVWLILFGLILLLSFSIILFLRKKSKPSLKKQATLKLKAIEKSFYETNDSLMCVRELSMFLRQVSLSKLDRSSSSQRELKNPAGMTGLAWLQWLDQPLKQPEFSQGAGKILITAPYKKEVTEADVSLLLALCSKWVRAL